MPSLSSDLESQGQLSFRFVALCGRKNGAADLLLNFQMYLEENADKVRLSVRLQIRKHCFTSHPRPLLCEEENRFRVRPAGPVGGPQAPAAAAMQKSEELKRKPDTAEKLCPAHQAVHVAWFVCNVPHPRWQ